MICDRNNSSKCTSCANNTFDILCSSKCSSGCLFGICDDMDGNCTQGCVNGKWGGKCEQNCSEWCTENMCDRSNGTCTLGCINNHSDITCWCPNRCRCDIDGHCETCLEGYGEMCEKNCSEGCKGKSCNRSTGLCLEGCIAGYGGPVCIKLVKPSNQSDNLTKILSIGGFVIALIIVVVLVVLVTTKKNRIKTREERQYHLDDAQAARQHNGQVSFLQELHPTERNNPGNEVAMIQMGIAVDELADYVAKREIEDFVEEFQLLPTGFTKPYEESQKEENKSKNKYAGIYPYDDSRVVLEGGTSDYINASFIDGYNNKSRAYIASVGPTAKHMDDFLCFWRMVWQQKCGNIIMLANIREGQDNKSEQYWPEQDYSGLYGDINITCHNEKKCAKYTVRTLELQMETEKRRVNHFHFTAWPEKGVPEDVMGLVEFQQVINNDRTELDGPTLVHCSAGVGLTGIFIALDILSKEGEASGRVDIFTCVRNLRYQRAKMVQTAEQYEFLHHALVRSLTPYNQLDFNSREQLEFNLYEECHNVTSAYITPVY